MTELLLLLVGAVSGVTTVLFGFGGGFVTVPAVLWANAALGSTAPTVAVATSSVVMVVSAAVATAATRREVLVRLRSAGTLLVLLATGGAVGALLARQAPGALISWLFILYLAVTIGDVLVRKGFVRPRRPEPDRAGRFAIPTWLGLPIGALAAFLGVGGSMMTVPLLRRSGLGMHTVAALANPLTLAISVPASIVFLLGNPVAGSSGATLLGAVDLRAAALLLAGGIPVVVLLRRRPPRIDDRVHAVGYVGLLLVVLVTMLVATLG
jgi:uncharacterized protein